MEKLLEKAEVELSMSREKIIEYGVKRLLLTELRNLVIEANSITKKYGVNSFDGLWEKLEKGEITEEECFNDLTKLEYFELKKDKIDRILKEEKKK